MRQVTAGHEIESEFGLCTSQRINAYVVTDVRYKPEAEESE